MSDLSTTVPRDEFATLTSDLNSLKSTITEIEVVKNCDFIEEEANSITGIYSIPKVQSCAEQSSHKNPLEPDDYPNPGINFSLF